MSSPLQQNAGQAHTYWGSYSPANAGGALGFPNVSVAGGGLPVPVVGADNVDAQLLANLQVGHSAFSVDTLQLFVCLDPGTPGVGDAIWAEVGGGASCFQQTIAAGSVSAGGLALSLDSITGDAVLADGNSRELSQGATTLAPVERAFVVGLACGTPDPLATQVGILESGPLTLGDWTGATGSATLIPGERYFLDANGSAGHLIAESSLDVHQSQFLVEVGEAANATTLMVAIKEPRKFRTHLDISGADVLGPTGTVTETMPVFWDPVAQHWIVDARFRRSMDTRIGAETEISARVDGMVWTKTLTADTVFTLANCEVGSTVWFEVDLAGFKLFLPTETQVLSGYHELSPTPTTTANPGQYFVDGAWVDGPVLFRGTCNGAGIFSIEVFAKPVATVSAIVDGLALSTLRIQTEGTLLGHLLGSPWQNSEYFLTSEGGGLLGDEPVLQGTATPGATVTIEIPCAGSRLPLRSFTPLGPPPLAPDLQPKFVTATADSSGQWSVGLGALPSSFHAGWRDLDLEVNSDFFIQRGFYTQGTRTYQPIVQSNINGLKSEFANDPYVRNADGSFDYTQPLDHYRFFVWSDQGPILDPRDRIYRDSSNQVEDWEPRGVDYLTAPQKARMWNPVVSDRPLWVSADPGFNGEPVIQFNNANQMLINSSALPDPVYNRVWPDGGQYNQTANTPNNSFHHWEWASRGLRYYFVIALDPYTGAVANPVVIDCSYVDSAWGWSMRCPAATGSPYFLIRRFAAGGGLIGVTPFAGNFRDGIPRVWCISYTPDNAGNYDIAIECDGTGIWTQNVAGTWTLPSSADVRSLAFGYNKNGVFGSPSLHTQDFRLGYFEWLAKGAIDPDEHAFRKQELKARFGI